MPATPPSEVARGRDAWDVVVVAAAGAAARAQGRPDGTAMLASGIDHSCSAAGYPSWLVPAGGGGGSSRNADMATPSSAANSRSRAAAAWMAGSLLTMLL